MEVANDSIIGLHLGRGETLDRVRSNFRRRCAKVRAIVRHLLTDEMSKCEGAIRRHAYHRTDFEKVANDLVGPLVRGDRGWLSHGLVVTVPISDSLDGGTLRGFTRDMRIAD